MRCTFLTRLCVFPSAPGGEIWLAGGRWHTISSCVRRFIYMILLAVFFKLFNYQVKYQLGKYTIAQDSYPLRFRVCVPPHVYMLLDIARASLWICTRGSLSSMVMHTPDARGS